MGNIYANQSKLEQILEDCQKSLDFFIDRTGLQIRIANSHDCEKLRSEANSLRFASHKIDSTSLRFRFAIFRMRSLSLRFRNLN